MVYQDQLMVLNALTSMNREHNVQPSGYILGTIKCPRAKKLEGILTGTEDGPCQASLLTVRGQ